MNADKEFFSAVKKGTEKMMSVENSNEVYGIQMNGNLFDKQTKFTKEGKMIQNIGKAEMIDAGFNVASMVVGQYYMSEINNKLEKLSTNIDTIINLLDSEYQGKIMQIVSKMQEIIENKNEILNNEFSRDKRYNEIVLIENSCAVLLGQSNDNIKKYIVKKEIDYKNYEIIINEINKWFFRENYI